MEITKSAQLTREALDSFKAIYNEVFGVDISDDEAQQMGISLLRLFLEFGKQLSDPSL